jgi:hypothetical protein
MVGNQVFLSLLSIVQSLRTAANDIFLRPQQHQESAPSQQAQSSSGKKPPRKLEMRMPNNGASPTNITFSAPFLDNTPEPHAHS